MQAELRGTVLGGGEIYRMTRGGKDPALVFDKGQGKFKQNDVVAVTR